MKIYPFDVELAKKDANKLIYGYQNVISVHAEEEFDFVMKILEEAGTITHSPLDTPVDAIIERLCQHCNGLEFKPFDQDSPAGMSALNEGWNCICKSCGRMTK